MNTTKRNGTKNRFWLVLIMLNILAMVYPLSLMCGAGSTDAQLLGTFVLIIVVFLLVVVDMVSILIAEAMGGPMGGKRQARIRPF
jgi:hypothetical protein